MRLITIGVCAASLGLTACHIGAEGSGVRISLGREAADRFEWQGEISAGQQIEVKGVDGEISAFAADGNVVHVSATRRGFRNDPDDVRIEVVEHDGGVTLCAVYPGGDNVCAPGDEGRLRAERNDVKVDFEVAVPPQVPVVARNVNGAVKALSLESDIQARTVNGGINISTTGHATAETVNGSIRATLGEADWTDEAVFETVNGSVTLAIPADTSATVDIRTSNGSIETDLPIEASRSSRRRLEGTLGDGQRALRVRTVNGSVRLRGLD